jgi:hypothetical protein
MRLNFTISRANVEALDRMLTALMQIWKQNSKIYFYFCKDLIVVYSKEHDTVDGIYGRINIVPVLNIDGADKSAFMTTYECKSQQENDAILLSPLKMSELLESLRMLSENGFDGVFKLRQKSTNGEVEKVLQISGSKDKDTNMIYCSVKVDTIFEVENYPETISNKDITFKIDAMIAEYFFRKFLDQLAIVEDQEVTLNFKIPNAEVSQGIEDDDHDAEDMYEVVLKTETIETKLKTKDLKFDVRIFNQKLTDFC